MPLLRTDKHTAMANRANSLSVKSLAECSSFAKWMGGYSQEEKERFSSWAEEVVGKSLSRPTPSHITSAVTFVTALNPNQAKPVTTTQSPAAARIQCSTDGRSLLPEYQPGDEKYAVEILEEFIQRAWSKSFHY